MGIVTSNICCLISNNQNPEGQLSLQEWQTPRWSHTPSFVSSGHLSDHPFYTSSVYTFPYITPNFSSNDITCTSNSAQDNNINTQIESAETQGSHWPLSTYAVFYPDNHPFSIIHVTCTVQGTKHGTIPSAYFYNNNPHNPLIYQTMLFRLRESSIAGAREIHGYIAGIRNINNVYVEFWLAGRAEDVSLSAYLIVPLDRAEMPDMQTQIKLSPQPQTPQPVHNMAQCQAKNWVCREPSHRFSETVRLPINVQLHIPFPKIEAPSPAYHPSIPRHPNPQWSWGCEQKTLPLSLKRYSLFLSSRHSVQPTTPQLSPEFSSHPIASHLVALSIGPALALGGRLAFAHFPLSLGIFSVSKIEKSGIKL